jgi:hypothetical protein
MSKITEKHLVGQSIFKQIVKMLPREQFELLVKQFGSDRYYKTYFSWDQLITMLFGIFSRCDSMGEVCDGMRALGGKLNHLAWVVTEGRRTYVKRSKSKNKSPSKLQLALF